MYGRQHEDTRFPEPLRDDHGTPAVATAMPRRQMREGVDAMGRGRAKAKQTKVARTLKYFSPDTDYSALERELHGQQYKDPDRESDGDEDDEDDGTWVYRDR